MGGRGFGGRVLNEVCDHESAAADVACGGIDDGEGKLGRDGGVNGITTLKKHGEPGGAGQRVGGDNGAVGYFGLSLDGI